VCRLAVQNGKLAAHPMHGGKVKRTKENNSRVRFLSPKEEARLRAVLLANPIGAPHLPEFDLALNTGLRRSRHACIVNEKPRGLYVSFLG